MWLRLRVDILRGYLGVFCCLVAYPPDFRLGNVELVVVELSDLASFSLSYPLRPIC